MHNRPIVGIGQTADSIFLSRAYDWVSDHEFIIKCAWQINPPLSTYAYFYRDISLRPSGYANNFLFNRKGDEKLSWKKSNYKLNILNWDLPATCTYEPWAVNVLTTTYLKQLAILDQFFSAIQSYYNWSAIARLINEGNTTEKNLDGYSIPTE